MNDVQLSGRIVERAALRYTPAGLPAMDIRLAHESELMHAGAPRKVSLEMHATAIGDLALDLARVPVGDAIDLRGFLGKQRNGKGVMLHISAFVPSSQSPNSN